MTLSAGIKRETWGCLPAIHGTQKGPLAALSNLSRQSRKDEPKGMSRVAPLRSVSGLVRACLGASKGLDPHQEIYTAPRARVDHCNEDRKVPGKRGSLFGGTMVEEYDDSDEREARNANK